jgi:hypothetical protein
MNTATTDFTITTYTSNLLGESDMSSTVLATPTLVAAPITINSLVLSSTLVAAAGVDLDTSLSFGSSVPTGSYILMTFDT